MRLPRTRAPLALPTALKPNRAATHVAPLHLPSTVNSRSVRCPIIWPSRLFHRQPPRPSSLAFPQLSPPSPGPPETSCGPDGIHSFDTATMSAPSPHKPRRRAKKSPNSAPRTTIVTEVVQKREPPAKEPLFPLASFLWPARGSTSQWEVLPLILMVVGLFRWPAGLWGYSGKHFLPRRPAYLGISSS